MALPQRIVITGGPGTGKTALCDALSAQGHTVFPEYSRVLIRTQLEIGGRVLPWDDLPAFSEAVIAGRIQQWQAANDPVQWYDRSLVDSLAYLHKDGLAIPKPWWELTENFRYHPVVLITPPWEQIYRKDEERRESFADLQAIHRSLCHVYEKAGYQLLEVPRTAVSARLLFVNQFLKTL